MKKLIIASFLLLSAFVVFVSYAPTKVQADTVVCPEGYICTPIAQQPTVVCPAGYICTPIQSSTPTYSTPPSAPMNLNSPSVLTPTTGSTLVKGTTVLISWGPVDASSNVYIMLSSTVTSAVYNIAQNISGSSYSWSVGTFTSWSSGTYSIPAGTYMLNICVSGSTSCSQNSTYITITDSSQNQTQGTVDLGSVFPYESTTPCPTPEYVRTYSIPAFSYPVKVVAATKIHADDYLTINGQTVWPTGINTDLPCGAPRLTSNGDKDAGYQFGQVIPAGTPIVIGLVDTVGLESGASGALNISPANSITTDPNPSEPSIQISNPIASLVPGSSHLLQWTTKNIPANSEIHVYLVGSNYSQKIATTQNLGSLSITIPPTTSSASNPYILMIVANVNERGYVDMINGLSVAQ